MKTIISFLLIGAKILLTKGFSLLLILLSFAIKGSTLHKNEEEWNHYFMRLTDHWLSKYAVAVYLAASVMSALFCYGGFVLFKFEHAFSLTVLIFIAGLLFSCIGYRRKGKAEILNGLKNVRESIPGLADKDAKNE